MNVYTTVNTNRGLLTVPTTEVSLYGTPTLFNGLLVGNRVFPTGEYCSVRFGAL